MKIKNEKNKTVNILELCKKAASPKGMELFFYGSAKDIRLLKLLKMRVFCRFNGCNRAENEKKRIHYQ